MRLLNLPPSLLATLLTVDLISFSSAAFSNGSISSSGAITTSRDNVGDYIISGLSDPSPTSNATQSITTSGADSSKSGLAYAQSCNAAWDAYTSSSLAYENQHGHNTTVKTTFAYTYTKSAAPASTHATSFTTLCDGHARVVGKATTYNASASLLTSVDIYNYTQSVTGTVYPSPTPTCFMGTSDCSLLWSSYSSVENALQTLSVYTAPVEPQCSTTSQTGYNSSGTATPTCANCEIVAAGARLLFWPVTTVLGSGNLCNSTASTITQTPTAGPSTFVTSGITITSPTVAISFSGLSRIDGCGTTIADTIIPVKPDEVYSVRGYHVFFDHIAFNYADFNYVCSLNASSDIPFEDRDDCYQNVPADAYFGGLQEASNIYAMNASQRANLTIWPDYHPQLLPPATMTPLVSRLWGNGCVINPDGVWDPPKALQAQSVEAGVTTDPGVHSSPVALHSVTTQAGVEVNPGRTTATTTSTPAAPAEISTSHVSATALPDTAVTTTEAGGGESGDDPSQSSVPGPSMPAADSGSESGTTPSGDASGSDDESSVGAAESSDPSAADSDSSGSASQDAAGVVTSVLAGAQSSDPATAADTIPSRASNGDAESGGQSTGSVASQTAQNAAGAIASILAGSSDDTSSSATDDGSTTGNGEVNESNGPSDPNTTSTGTTSAGAADAASSNNSGGSIALPTVSVSLSAVPIETAQNGALIVGTATLTPGVFGQTINGQYVSAASSAIIIGSGSSKTTLSLPELSAAATTSPSASSAA